MRIYCDQMAARQRRARCRERLTGIDSSAATAAAAVGESASHTDGDSHAGGNRENLL